MTAFDWSQPCLLFLSRLMKSFIHFSSPIMGQRAVHGFMGFYGFGESYTYLVHSVHTTYLHTYLVVPST